MVKNLEGPSYQKVSEHVFCLRGVFWVLNQFGLIRQRINGQFFTLKVQPIQPKEEKQLWQKRTFGSS